MPREYAFLKDKKKRDEFIREFVNIINEISLNEPGNSKRIYKAENFIKLADDPKRIEDFLKAREVFENDKKRHEYGDKLLNGKKLGGNFGRIFYHKLTIPKENDPNKEEIERKNMEIVNKFTDPERVGDILREEIEIAFKADKTLFYPENLDEAISNFEKYPGILNSCFALDSVIQNNGMIPSSEFRAEYEHYKTLIEDGGTNWTYIDEKASPFSLFIPDDFDTGLLMLGMGKINELANKYSEFEIRTDAVNNEVTLFTTHLLDRNLYGEPRKKLKEFFKANDKNHDFILKHRSTGKNFRDDLMNAQDNAKDIIIDGFKGAKSIENGNTITIDSSRQYSKAYDDAVEIYKKYKNGLHVEDVLNNFVNKKTNKYIESKMKVAYFLHAMITDKPDDRSYQVINGLEDYLDEFKAPVEASKNYLLVAKKIVPVDAICAISKDGFKVCPRATDLYKSKVEIQNQKQQSIGTLRKAFDKGDIKTNITKDPTKLMTLAKVVNEKYNSRHPFFQIFSPFAWREKKFINDINKFASENGIDQTKLNDFINSNEETYNDKFKECSNSIKGLAQPEEEIGTRERIDVDVFNIEANKEQTKQNEIAKDLSKEFEVINKEDAQNVLD